MFIPRATFDDHRTVRLKYTPEGHLNYLKSRLRATSEIATTAGCNNIGDSTIIADDQRFVGQA
jgi:hypothetical protein